MDITGHEVGALGRRVYNFPVRLAVRSPIPSLWTTEDKIGWQLFAEDADVKQAITIWLQTQTTYTPRCKPRCNGV